MNSQNARILAALCEGDRLTPLEALERFDCWRLAARIRELRLLGWEIETLNVTSRTGDKTYAVYYLPANKRVRREECSA